MFFRSFSSFSLFAFFFFSLSLVFCVSFFFLCILFKYFLWSMKTVKQTNIWHFISFIFNKQKKTFGFAKKQINKIYDDVDTTIQLKKKNISHRTNNNTMAGKNKELCTRYTNIESINTCPSSIHRRRRWRRHHHRNSIIIFNGHRYSAHGHQSISNGSDSGRQGCRKKQTKWNETASPFTAATLCKISWRKCTGLWWTLWFGYFINVW